MKLVRPIQKKLHRGRRHVRDGIHEGDVDLDGLGDQVLDFSEHGKVVLGLDILRVRGVEAGDEAAQGCDPDALTDAEDGWDS